MGVDWLDITFRLERQFDIKFEPKDFAHIWDSGRRDITAEELFDVVCTRLQTEGRPVPFSAWNRVRLELARALDVPPNEIRRKKWLVSDLGME
jgi:hypothetical protein